MRGQYWIVVCETRGPSAAPFKHVTEHAAVTEASRLARENPGHRFTVFASICAVERKDIRKDIQITPLSSGFHFDDEIPF